MALIPNHRVQTIAKLFAALSLIMAVFITIEYSQAYSTLSGALIRVAALSAPPTTTAAANQAAQMKVSGIWADLNVTHGEALFPPDVIGGYVFLNPDLCRGVDAIDFIIIVHTKPDHLEHRQRIRGTFAREALFLPSHVRVAFLLGRPKNATLETVLLDEHVSHNDTVMGDFYDDYHNLTLKGVMGYRWVSQHCRNARVILKIDDDVMVNTYKLLHAFYHHIEGKNKSIFCNLWNKHEMGILRSGKWEVPRNHFPGRNTYPYYYCSGFVVIMTADLAAPMYEASKATPFFWIDDVYLYGMLPYVVGGVTYHEYSLNRNVSLSSSDSMSCTKVRAVQCPILASLVGPQEFHDFWKIIQDIYATDQWKVQSKFVE